MTVQSAPKPETLPVTVIVASVDRPAILQDLLTDLAQQTIAPRQIVLSVTRPEDLPRDLPPDERIRVLVGPKGSCVQRNTALIELGPVDGIILFCDDDYVPSRFLVERVQHFFAANPDVVGASGFLLADGINGPGISVADARAMVADNDAQPAPPPVPVRDRLGLYGCNMAFRAEHLGDVRFDEALPLYGWQEDIDFAAQVLKHGRLVGTRAFAGVHRGVKLGRSSGIRLGYSQVINPAYLVRKGTMRRKYAFKIVVRNIAANHARAFRPEPWIDRLGRVKGNWMGLIDLARGKIRPDRVARL